MNIKLAYRLKSDEGGERLKKTKKHSLMFMPRRGEVISFEEQTQIVKDTGKRLWTVLTVKHVFGEEGYLFTEVRISPIPDQVTL